MISGKFDQNWYSHKPSPDGLDPELHLPEDLEEEAANLVTRFSSFMEGDLPGLPDLQEMPAFLPSQFAQRILRIPNKKGTYAPFSFEGRKHLPAIYDTPAKRILMCCARQVEKCVSVHTPILTADGVKRAGEIQVGDRVLGLGADGTTLEWVRVTWRSEVVRKEAYRVTLQGGVTVVAGAEHPFRTYRSWTRAQDLKPRTRVEVVSEVPEIPGAKGSPIDAMRAAVLDALRICGASSGRDSWFVTIRHPNHVKELLYSVLRGEGSNGHSLYRVPNGSYTLGMHGRLATRIAKRQKNDGLQENLSTRLGSVACKMAVRVLWLIKGRFDTKVGATEMLSLSLDLSSQEEADEVQAIHNMAGVEVGVEARHSPANNSFWWRIRPQGRGTAALLKLLPRPLVQSLPEPVPGASDDTMPKEWHDEVRRVYREREKLEGDPTAAWRGSDRKGGRNAHYRSRKKIVGPQQLWPHGLHRIHALERLDKIMVTHGSDGLDARLLHRELQAPTRWSRVRKVEPCGEVDMVDLQVDGGGDSFVAAGVVTHNSTYLGNRLLMASVAYPGHKSLYVSPSSIQTKTFSRDRLRNPIETSTFLRDFARSGGNQNIHEMEFGNSSNIILRSAFLSADRCLSGDTPVYLSDAPPLTLAEAYARRASLQGRLVWAAQNGRMVQARVEGVLSRGIRSLREVRFRGGAVLRMTPDHRLLTPEGWREVQEIGEGGWVAVPRSLPHGPGSLRSIEEVALLGYLMGDGCLVDRVTFSSCIEKVTQHVTRLAESQGFSVRESLDERTKGVPTRNLSLSNGARAWASSTDLWGKRSAEKRLPADLWAMDEAQLCAFLDALYSCDGWIASGNTVEVGYSTSSPWLARELVHLLLRLGLYATLSEKPPSTAEACGSFQVTLRDARQVHLFLQKIPVLGREEAREQALRDISGRKGRGYSDRVPISYALLRKRLREKHGLSTHTAWTKHGIQLRPGNRKDSVGTQVLARIARKLGDEELLELTEGGLRFVQITRITQLPEEETFDLYVPGPENFLSEVLVHNCRGIPAYLLCLDELQDLLAEHIPVIEPCTSHAPPDYRVHIYSGTPKSYDNVMEFYRSGFVAGRPMSTLGEWMVPCDRCGSSSGYRFWQALGTKNIQKKGLSCEKCGELLDCQHDDARWVHHQADGKFESYRIPQLMVPWRPWDELYSDYLSFSNAKFHNEVLGLSMDDHSRPLSMTEMRACCDNRLRMAQKGAFTRKAGWTRPVFMGIDWGSGTTSYTVITLGTYVGNVFTIFYMQRFTGMLLDVEEQKEEILRILREYNVARCGTDFGYGQLYNDHLIRHYGRDRIAVYQHLGRVVKKIAYDTKMLRWKLFRSAVMADFINMIKRRNIRFPHWEDTREPFAQDFCNISAELSEQQGMVIYSHRPDRPDDSFHSSLYCLLASTIDINRPDIFAPLHNRYNQGPIHSLPGPINQG